MTGGAEPGDFERHPIIAAAGHGTPHDDDTNQFISGHGTYAELVANWRRVVTMMLADEGSSVIE